jgi:ribonuclease Z
MKTWKCMPGAGALLVLATFLIALNVSPSETGALGLVSTAIAKEPKGSGETQFSPVKALKDRDVYYPGTEDLSPDEMRVVACGTGMPNARPKQAAACFLVELGNGDKFLFDIGFGSAERIAAPLTIIWTKC